MDTLLIVTFVGSIITFFATKYTNESFVVQIISATLYSLIYGIPY